MPKYTTRILNSEFISEDNGRDYATHKIAVEQSITAAMEVAHDILRGGAQSTAVEARLQIDGRVVSRHIVMLSMMTTDEEPGLSASVPVNGGVR